MNCSISFEIEQHFSTRPVGRLSALQHASGLKA
jgi:hypothetical protein